MGDGGREARARALAPAGLARRPPPGRDRLRGRRARRRADRDLLRARDARARAGRRRPAPRQGVRGEGADPGRGARRRRPRRARARDARERPAAGVRDGAPVRLGRRGERRGRLRRGGRARRARRGRVVPAVEVRRVPLGRGTRPRGARRAHAGPRGTDRLRRDRGRPRRSRRRLLGAQRRRGRGRAGRAAGGPLQPVPAAAGDRVRRRPRRGGQGRERARLRGPLLLGHRDLRRPVPRPHDAAVGQAGARVPLRDAAGRAPAGGRDRPRRRRVPVAHDRRPRGVRVVRGRHGAVPHQRRHRARDAPVQPRHGRPRVHARPRRRGRLRDRAAVDGAGVLLRAPRRPVLHQQRHRARTSTRPSSTTTPTRT